jgi:hypothetical protein
MAVNNLGKSRFKVGSLLVGEGPSDGGGGAVGSTGTPIALKGLTAYTATVNAAALSGTTLTFTTGVSQTVTFSVTGVNVNPGGSAAPTTTPNDVVAVAADGVLAIPPANFIATGLTYNAYVPSTNHITLVITNGTGGSLVLVAGMWTFLIFKLIAG